MSTTSIFCPCPGPSSALSQAPTVFRKESHSPGAAHPAPLASCPPSFPVPLLLASGPQASKYAKICFLFPCPQCPHVLSLLSLPGFSPAPSGLGQNLSSPSDSPALLVTASFQDVDGVCGFLGHTALKLMWCPCCHNLLLVEPELQGAHPCVLLPE